MRFLFLTDFHGNRKAYKRTFRQARFHDCKAIVNGGDTLPKGFKPGTPFAKAQKEFFDTWLYPKIEALRQDGIDFYMMFGNDDSKAVLNKTLDKAHSQGVLKRLDLGKWLLFGDYEIIGMPWVPDYPFALKDWCCGDMEPVVNPTQFGRAVLTDQFHFVPMDKPWAEELASRPTLKQRLADLPKPRDVFKAVFVCHSPPSHGGLDVCADGRRVGSKAVLEHIRRRHYMMTLHGHIHESPKTSGKWHAYIGDSLCVQPGALPPMHTLIDLDAGHIENNSHGEIKLPRA